MGAFFQMIRKLLPSLKALNINTKKKHSFNISLNYCWSSNRHTHTHELLLTVNKSLSHALFPFEGLPSHAQMWVDGPTHFICIIS